MNENYSWFLNADLSGYEGKYVAIAKESVVFSGEDPGEVYEKAKSVYPNDEVVLWKVPEAEVFIFAGV